MDRKLKTATEEIAQKYATLIEKRLDAALKNELPVDVAMGEINEGIKMMGYLITAIERMGRSTSGN